MQPHPVIEVTPDNYPSVDREPLAPVELRAKAHWERFCPSRVRHLRAQGGEKAFETAIRAAWWQREYQTMLAMAASPGLHELQAQEPFQALLWPPPEQPAPTNPPTTA